MSYRLVDATEGRCPAASGVVPRPHQWQMAHLDRERGTALVCCLRCYATERLTWDDLRHEWADDEGGETLKAARAGG